MTAKPRIQYADDAVGPYKLYWDRLSPEKRRPGQDQFGYGMKITSDMLLQFDGQKEFYRVYCTQISNAGSNWINVRGQQLFLRHHDVGEILEKP